MFGYTLSRLPVSAKVFCTLFLVGMGAANLAGFVQAATAIGLSPADVAASLAPEEEAPMLPAEGGAMTMEHEIDIGQLSHAARVRIRTPLLIQTSHTHLFSMTLVAGLLGLVFLFSCLPERTKALIIALPFVGTLMDIGGMWLAKFVWQPLSVLVIVGGSLFGLGYLLISLISLYELWLKKEVPA